MRIAVVAGPDAGHAFPAFALAERLNAAGFESIVYTGARWCAPALRCGVDVAELPGLAAVDGDDDADAGAKLSRRAARIAVALAPQLATAGVDLVISDVITVGGAWAAELAGIDWIELSPHPLYRPSRGRPPIGAGLEPGVGVRGRLRDATMRAATGRSLRVGERQRSRARAEIGLTGAAGVPIARFVATLPALEVWRPDWPSDTHLIGPLLWEPTDATFTRPSAAGPLVLVAPSTAATGTADLASTALAALTETSLGMTVRVVVSALERPDGVAESERVVVGNARQDEILQDTSLVICGGGHGMLVKALSAGVPVVTVPGGGDQWELANRVTRQGSGLLVRPPTVESMALAARQVLTDPGFAVAARDVSASASGVVDPVRIVREVMRRRG
ncbi:nucleotide disphospho-sugar-binding domain-containing protein [Gordonia sp. LSe1-13]|uniref:Nucleotide disphospho-sugar-binding domain-containing protein n=1 Tax=Gordonia sesuvii TaxID=3116777 RepID=A0ABU7MBV5_9ACTN|nr:nucleotide disphospho-sugar-binding domain-containing protein [Gordonia sp. LSe1-13]